MKKLSLIALFFCSSLVMAENALIGIYCQVNTDGMKVYVDDEFKFECSDFKRKPLLVAAGLHEIKAVLTISKEQEKVFSKQVDLSAGQPQRVRIILPESISLTHYGLAMKKKRDAELARKLALEKERKAKEAVKRDLANAKKGDLDAIQRMIARYQHGDGLEKDPVQLDYWQQQYMLLSAEKKRKAKIASLEDELANNPYFYWLGLFPRAMKNADPSESSTLITGLPFYTIGDLTSSPSVYFTRKDIKERLEEIESHAVRWAKPNSMVAKAER